MKELILYEDSFRSYKRKKIYKIFLRRTDKKRGVRENFRGWFMGAVCRKSTSGKICCSSR
ncbi:hypothetical protein [Clostridium beijerinckii]|uniref:hypothetical protein n=1 Tax=Clostridium beijerinckii TaxID=1520 RepID=UPI00232B56C1|nr:hypothetical protein [Clostridium beijerinckii]